MWSSVTRRTCVRLAVVLVAGLFFVACNHSAEEPLLEDPEYETVDDGHPDGTGKVYQGREIGRVTGQGMIEHLERPEREVEELSGRVVDALPLEPDSRVADIGAGSGFFTLRLGERVPEGRVYAVDIQDEMLEHIQERVEEEGLENVEVVKGSLTDPNLPENGVDLVLIVDAYHQFSHPFEMKQAIKHALVPGGQIVLVEFRGEDDTIPLPETHRMTEEQLQKEFAAVGFSWRETRRFLPQQHFIVFQKPAD